MICSSANRHRLQHEKKYIKCQIGMLGTNDPYL